MAAAFELSRPEHEGRYEVTVYQIGWRLGGKGASGRGPNGRIEEHGLHVWMGWYENAFRLLRECYGELGRDWRAQFDPASLVAVTDRTADNGWVPWTRLFPPTEGLPGDAPAGAQPWTAARYMARAAQLLRALVTTLDPETARSGPAQACTHAETFDLVGTLARYGQVATLGGIVHAISLLETALGSQGENRSNVLLGTIDTIRSTARSLLEQRLEHDLTTRRIWQVLDLTLATMRGNLRFGLLTDPRGFDIIDGYECREWLLLNGASPRSVDSAYMRGLYDLGFSYEDGDPAKPCVSAAQALRGYLRSFFTYRGAFFWKMNAGMGDVVFAPFYEALVRRGVRFEFFHRLRNVGLGGRDSGPNQHPHVARLDFDIQARVRNGRYDPLIDVKGLPCWPAAPLYAQLEDGDRLQSEGWRFESHWEQRRAGTRTLEVGRDFDFVVLGVGVGEIPYVCRELIDYDPRWREMVHHVKTVATHAFQLWLRPTTEELGWSGPPITLSAFERPFETWADMRHLISREAWPEPPGSIAYFCGVMPEPEPCAASDIRYLERQREAVRADAVRFLEQHMHHLWPRAVDSDGQFRWELLMSGDGAGSGEDRFLSQYWTANVNPTDRYTLAVPGSSAYRISPLDSTYDNFTICGDWTDCGFNAGCVEAAVMSGRLAAHALSTEPALEDIVGFDHP